MSSDLREGLKKEQSRIKMKLLTPTLTRMLQMPDCHESIAPSNFTAARDSVQALMVRVKGGELSFAEYESEAREVLARLGRSMDATAP